MAEENLAFGTFLAIIALVVGIVIGKLIADLLWKQKVKEERKEAVQMSRSVLTGQFSEQIAPFLPNFKYNPSEARFIGKPIDFVIFKGISQGKVEEVVFLEVKSGKSTMNNNEKSLKDAIDNKKVKYEVYQVPEELTKNTKQ